MIATYTLPWVLLLLLLCKSNQIRFISGNIWPIKTTKKTTKKTKKTTKKTDRQTDIRTYSIEHTKKRFDLRDS